MRECLKRTFCESVKYNKIGRKCTIISILGQNRPRRCSDGPECQITTTKMSTTTTTTTTSTTKTENNQTILVIYQGYNYGKVPVKFNTLTGKLFLHFLFKII